MAHPRTGDVFLLIMINHQSIHYPQGIYIRNEIPIADYLMSYQTALRDEFMSGFSSLRDAISNEDMINSLDRTQVGIPLEKTVNNALHTKFEGTDEFVPNVNGWKALLFKYENARDNVSLCMEENKQSKYPTASKLVREFGVNCPIAHYSCMAPNTVLHRHTGVENRNGKYIRIHIPLIVPEGDIFFEVNGEEVKWDDIFGFNNQLVHSAHNYTNEYRLIFLIDLDREFIGMPAGEPYDPALEHEHPIPFVRKNNDNTSN